MPHGGKLTTLEAMGAPRFDARLGDVVAATPTASPALVRETLHQVETTRDQMANELASDSAALADAVALRREAIVLGPLAWARGRVHLASTLDDNVGVEMEYSSRVVYRQRFVQNGVKTTIDQQLVGIRRSGNGLVASFRHELTAQMMELKAQQVIVENGTVPVDDVFAGLSPQAVNRGITDIERLIAREPQLDAVPAGGAFELHRIGDAVTSRGVHSAIYDALRLASAL